MRLSFSLLAYFILTSPLLTQQITIIPHPVEMKVNKGSFTLSGSTVIIVKNGADDNTADFFNDYLKQYFGIKLKKVKSATSNYIQFTTLQTLAPGKEGAYSLTVGPKTISIQGQTASGTFYGMQTLIQLLPVKATILKASGTKLSIPNVSISDFPRFAYRGMHLDVGRHFFPVSFIKKYIDYLALHKFNTFHWHLTEDQGWRIEIKKYPKLTSIGAWRNGTIIGRYPGTGNDGIRYGGFYTQEEIKQVVKYAADRYIDVIPEIELPGHSSAAIAAYPELSCFPDEPTIKYFPRRCTWHGDSTGKQVQQTWGVFSDVFCAGQENTFQFLQDVIDEVVTLFPSRYIHVGGDECPKENWKRCPVCQQRMKDNGLKDEHALQSYFIQRMEKYINGKGKTLIGWDEILEGGLAPNAIVMSWRGEQGGIQAAKEKHTVIMTPGNPVYFDHSQSKNEDSVTIGGYNPIEKVYAYEPIPKELNADDAKYVLGAQANVWTEYMKNTRKVEYMVFPRMAAMSEVLWSPKEKKNWSDFEKRLQMQFKRYDLWKANYSKAYFDLSTSVKPSEKYSAIQWEIQTKWPYGKIGYLKLPRSSQINDYKGPIQISQTSELGVVLIDDGRITSNMIWQKFRFNKATGKKITLTSPPSDKYPGDGAFTLVNGVQNEKGLARSGECLGFEAGAECEAVIDLGSSQTISNAVVHTLSSGGSWVYPPRYAEVFISTDGQNFSSAGKSEKFETSNGSNGIIKVSFAPASARYIKVFVKNFGTIPEGMSGAGNGAWLFVDEIEIN